MEGKRPISRYLRDKAQRALTTEGRKIFALAEPLIEGKPTELALWFSTIEHLLEDDLDLTTRKTEEVYPELKSCEPLWLLTEIPLIRESIETLLPEDEKQTFQKVYQVARTSCQNPSKLQRNVYPAYIEIAAKWWLQNNIESLTAWQEDRFLARLKKQMEEQIRETGVSLICTMENKRCNSSKLSVHLGGLETTVLYPQYMAMIGSVQKITVQQGRQSHWTCIWKAEIVENETKGEEV